MSNPTIHPRTQRVFNACVEFASKHAGVSPTFRQLMQATGITSTSVMAKHIQILAKLGWLKLNGHRIQIVGGHWRYDGPNYRPEVIQAESI